MGNNFCPGIMKIDIRKCWISFQRLIISDISQNKKIIFIIVCKRNIYLNPHENTSILNVPSQEKKSKNARNKTVMVVSPSKTHFFFHADTESVSKNKRCP